MAMSDTQPNQKIDFAEIDWADTDWADIDWGASATRDDVPLSVPADARPPDELEADATEADAKGAVAKGAVATGAVATGEGAPSGPRSRQFDDIYFAGDGLAESRHVFLDGNDLAARFADARAFVIAETGFGTGLNIMAAIDLWSRTQKRASARLTLITTERYPLCPDDIVRAHAAFPTLRPIAARLRAIIPPPVAGLHARAFSADIDILFAYGDVTDALAQIDAGSGRANTGGVDAWFLDGFAPSRNPDMWRPAMFAEIARLSAPGATFATFTVAGAVRRAAEGAGFTLARRPGFGRKREMLTGRINAPPSLACPRPWFARPEPIPDGPASRDSQGKPPPRIAIIGGGIAGAAAAHALRRRGADVLIIDPDGFAAGASGNPAGIIMPRLDLGDGPLARFSRAAYLYTLNLLHTTQAGIFTQTGVRQPFLTDDDAARARKLKAAGLLPPSLIAFDDDAITFPQGGIVDPARWVAALAGDTPLVRAKAMRIDAPYADGAGVTSGRALSIHLQNGDHLDADGVILANGRDALRFVQASGLPLASIAGQIEHLPGLAPPDTTHANGPYAAPAPSGGNQKPPHAVNEGGHNAGTIIGASYTPIDAFAVPVADRAITVQTIENARRLSPAIDTALAATAPAAAHSRAAIRAQTPDRAPIVGALPDWGFYSGAYDDLRFGRQRRSDGALYPPADYRIGLYALTGLGSRGLVTAPLAAELLAALIFGEPLPVEQDVTEALHPARFFIRDLKRARPVKPLSD